MEILLTLGAASSALMGIGALIITISKKPRVWIKNWVLNVTRAEIDEKLKPVIEKLDFVVAKVKEMDEADKTRLGHSIMTIYDRSMARGYITLADKKDLIELHQRYHDKHGNHHVDEYYEIMLHMDVR